MLTVVLIWLYVIATSFLIGFSFLKKIVGLPGMARGRNDKRKKYYEFKYLGSYILIGIALETVYAEIFSIFWGVGLLANLILVFVCIFIAIYFRKSLSDELSSKLSELKSGGNLYICIILFFVFAYGTSHGIMHYDSDLYHAQAIRWIEEYGLVKGLGNLHVRLAYNSAAFPLCALYSFSFLGGQSYHVMAGFLAMLLSCKCINIRYVVRRGCFLTSDFARFAAIYYLFTIYDEMVSPASDYFLTIAVFYMIILWLDIFEKHERSKIPYILLALLGVYAITIKLSAAPMVLMAIIPIYRIINDRRKEKYMALGVFVAMALILGLPFLIRNVLISGWLLYPVTALDFFGFEWKIPKGLAEYDALEIRTFGRGFNDVASSGNLKFTQWFPTWFSSVDTINKVMLVLCVISFIVYIACFVWYLRARLAIEVEEKSAAGKNGVVLELKHRQIRETGDFLIISGALIACLIFWFVGAPLIRYGVVYVWLVPAVILGKTITMIFDNYSRITKDILLYIVGILFVIWMIYKCAMLISDDRGRFNAEYLIKQQDYGTYETYEFDLDGETIYYPADGDRIGYYPFPAATHDITGEAELIGDDIGKGFRPVGN